MNQVITLVGDTSDCMFLEAETCQSVGHVHSQGIQRKADDECKDMLILSWADVIEQYHGVIHDELVHDEIRTSVLWMICPEFARKAVMQSRI